MNAKLLAEAGFETVDPSNAIARPRLTIDVYGMDKVGKTHFGFTAPGPLGYQSFDYGDEGVIHKFVDQKPIVRKSYKRRIPDTVDRSNLETVKTYAKAEIDKFDKDFDTLLKSGLRSVVWDTGTEYAEILRLMYFGRLEKVPAQFYGAVNSHFQDIVRRANESATNLVLIHRAKDEWGDVVDAMGNKVVDRSGNVKREPTGKKLRQGNETAGYLVQASVYFSKIPAVIDKRSGAVKEHARTQAEIVACRHNRDLEGLRLEDVDFPTLANLIMPEVDVEEWL